MKIVDTKGQLCPAPIIATKKALKETSPGGTFVVITDNQTSFNNISRFLNDNSTPFKVTAKDGEWEILVTKTSADIVHHEVQDYCSPVVPHFEKGDFIIVLASDKMGEGDEQLGTLLMANFIKAIKDLERLPRKIIFYNKGVTLVTRNSPLADHLKDIEKMGVELLICATCVNHYCLEASMATGTLSNMYVIAEAMASAGNIVRP